MKQMEGIMEIELRIYPVGNSYGATMKTASGETFVYLNGIDPLDAILSLLHRCFSPQYRTRRAA
jgi:hypothetical protein